MKKKQRQRETVIDIAGLNCESPWSINDHSTSKVNTRQSSTETLSNQSTQTIPPINKSNVNLDDISILDREQLLLNRITAGDIANKHLHEQIKASEERAKRTSPFTPIPNELTSATCWTPSGLLPTVLGTPTYQHQPYQYSTIVTKQLASETPTIKTWSHSEVLLFEIWCNRHNVKQMNQRDAWDIISSTFNDDILETLNQLVAIHLEDSNHIVVDVREFPINHLILLLKEISPADMSGQGYMSSDSVVTNLLRETGRIISVTRAVSYTHLTLPTSDLV